eukprot:gene21149-28038_t
MVAPKQLILMKGHPGVGKSSLARALAARLHMPLIDKDDAKDCMQQYSSHSSNHTEVDWNRLSYSIMFRMAETQLELLPGVIVDCPLATVQLYETAKEIAQRHNATVLVVECCCSDDGMWKERLERRGETDKESTRSHKPCSWQQLQELLSRYDGCYKWTSDGSTRVDCLIVVDSAAVSTDGAVKNVLEYIEQMRGRES